MMKFYFFLVLVRLGFLPSHVLFSSLLSFFKGNVWNKIRWYWYKHLKKKAVLFPSGLKWHGYAPENSIEWSIIILKVSYLFDLWLRRNAENYKNAIDHEGELSLRTAVTGDSGEEAAKFKLRHKIHLNRIEHTAWKYWWVLWNTVSNWRHLLDCGSVLERAEYLGRYWKHLSIVRNCILSWDFIISWLLYSTQSS